MPEEKDKITKLSEEQIDSFNKTGTFESVEKKAEEKPAEITIETPEGPITYTLEQLKKMDKPLFFSGKSQKEAKQSFYKKLAEIQGEEIEILKSAYMNYKDYYYANLDDILKAYKPLLTKHNLVVVNNLDIETMILTTRIIDIENPELEEKATWKVFGKNSQELGAAITYGKRYLISALLNVATGEDFDGETPATVNNAVKQGGYNKPTPAKTTPKPAVKPTQNKPAGKTPAPTPQIENNPVKPAKKTFPISEKQLAFAKDLYDKYKTAKGTEAWALEKILAEKYAGKTTLKSLTGTQAKDFIEEMLKRV